MHYPLTENNPLEPSSLRKYAMTFSSNSCLKWGTQVCQKATYFCSIDGEIIHIVKLTLFEEAIQDCILKNGYLSMFDFESA